MNRYVFAALFCEVFGLTTIILIAQTYGWNTYPYELPSNIFILDCIAFLVSTFGFAFFGLLAVAKEISGN